MPIIQVPNIYAALSQGDILRGPKLFITKKIGEENGNQPAALPFELCLVLSRPCVAEREREVIVAAVGLTKAKPPKTFGSFDEICDYFKYIRDGSETPDVFYLGQLPGCEGCFVARLDSLHTIQIPTDRAEFLKKHRIATLCTDFLRDLHLRIFRAFASLGFDDHGWFADEDLKAIISRGDTELKKAEYDISEIESNLQAGLSQSFNHPNDKKKLESDLQAKKTTLEKLKGKLEPYKAELAKRPNTGISN